MRQQEKLAAAAARQLLDAAATRERKAASAQSRKGAASASKRKGMAAAAHKGTGKVAPAAEQSSTGRASPMNLFAAPTAGAGAFFSSPAHSLMSMPQPWMPPQLSDPATWDNDPKKRTANLFALFFFLPKKGRDTMICK